MSIEVSYSEARNNLASLLDRVTEDCEVAVIRRRGHEGVAMISESELSGLLETAYLLRSPKNAERLLRSLKRAQSGTTTPRSIEDLKKEFGIKTRD